MVDFPLVASSRAKARGCRPNNYLNQEKINMFFCNQPTETEANLTKLKRLEGLVNELELKLDLPGSNEATSTTSDVTTYPAQMQLLKQYKNELLTLADINIESKLAFLVEYYALLNAYQKFKNVGSSQSNDRYSKNFNDALLNMADATLEFYGNNVEQFANNITTPPIALYKKIDIATITMLVIGCLITLAGVFSAFPPLMALGLTFVIGSFLGYGHFGCVQLPRLNMFHHEIYPDFNAIKNSEGANTTSTDATTNAKNSMGGFKHCLNQLFHNINKQDKDIEYKPIYSLFGR